MLDVHSHLLGVLLLEDGDLFFELIGFFNFFINFGGYLHPGDRIIFVLVDEVKVVDVD